MRPERTRPLYQDALGNKSRIVFDNGDMCLKHLAETMQQCFPKDSILGRYGGDEFVVYLKNMTAETVKRYIEEFQKKSANLTLSTGEKVQLTTSYRAVQREQPQKLPLPGFSLPSCLRGVFNLKLYMSF